MKYFGMTGRGSRKHWKNDFSLSTRQYALTKKDESELYALAVEFGAALGIEHLPKYQLKKLGKTYEQLTKNQP